MSEGIRDPGLYRRLSEPHASEAAADKALTDFDQELRELRKKYGIPEVHVIMCCNYIKDGQEEQRVNVSSHGDPARALLFFGTAYRHAREQAEELIERVTGETRPRR